MMERKKRASAEEEEDEEEEEEFGLFVAKNEEGALQKERTMLPEERAWSIMTDTKRKKRTGG